MTKITSHRAFQPVAMLLIILLILGFLDRYTGVNVVPNWVMYRTYSAENFPITFEFPRHWSVVSKESNKAVVEYQRGHFTNATGIIVTLFEREVYLDGMDTIQQRLYETARVNEEAWLNTTAFELQEGRPTFYNIIVDENGELVEDKNKERSAGFLRAFHPPRSLTYRSQGLEWHYLRSVSHVAQFFTFYVVAMEAVTEMDDKVVKVRVVCFHGDIPRCENVFFDVLPSLELDF